MLSVICTLLHTSVALYAPGSLRLSHCGTQPLLSKEVAATEMPLKIWGCSAGELRWASSRNPTLCINFWPTQSGIRSATSQPLLYKLSRICVTVQINMLRMSSQSLLRDLRIAMLQQWQSPTPFMASEARVHGFSRAKALASPTPTVSHLH